MVDGQTHRALCHNAMSDGDVRAATSMRRRTIVERKWCWFHDRSLCSCAQLATTWLTNIWNERQQWSNFLVLNALLLRSCWNLAEENEVDSNDRHFATHEEGKSNGGYINQELNSTKNLATNVARAAAERNDIKITVQNVTRTLFSANNYYLVEARYVPAEN